MGALGRTPILTESVGLASSLADPAWDAQHFSMNVTGFLKQCKSKVKLLDKYWDSEWQSRMVSVKNTSNSKGQRGLSLQQVNPIATPSFAPGSWVLDVSRNGRSTSTGAISSKGILAVN